VSSQWISDPNEKSFCFFFFRWILCFYFIGAILYSYETSIEQNYSEFWFIFLSHWGLLINLTTMTCYAIMVSFHYFNWTTPSSQSIVYQVCWFLSSVSTSLSLMISFVYWKFMFDGEFHFHCVLIDYPIKKTYLSLLFRDTKFSPRADRACWEFIRCDFGAADCEISYARLSLCLSCRRIHGLHHLYDHLLCAWWSQRSGISWSVRDS
jgi:hypothetical protein